MNHEKALEIVVARTGNRRLLWLCSDDNPDAAKRQHYRDLMVRIAERPVRPDAPPMTALYDTIRAAKLGFRKCLYSSHEGCGCSGTRCFHQRRIVSLKDCVECLSGSLFARPVAPSEDRSASPAAGRQG